MPARFAWADNLFAPFRVTRADLRPITLILIAALGAAGALSRYGLSSFTQSRLAASWPVFPYGTLVVNVLGCFLLGFVVHYGQHSSRLPEEWRLGITWGLLGALTTFSTFGMDTVAAFEHGRTTAALLNIGLSVVLGLAAVWAGLGVARLMVPAT